MTMRHDDDEDDYQPEPQGPPERLALIKERHQALLERKRARLHLAAQVVTVPVREHRMKPTVAPTPVHVPVPGSHARKGADYVAIMREIGRPCGQPEIAARAGVNQVSVCLWLKRHAARLGITCTKDGKRKLYALAGWAA